MFEMYDVGYTKSTRSEFLSFLSVAKAVIFVVDLTDFDQIVPGDKTGKNKMVKKHLTFSLFFFFFQPPYISYFYMTILVIIFLSSLYSILPIVSKVLFVHSSTTRVTYAESCTKS